MSCRNACGPTISPSAISGNGSNSWSAIPGRVSSRPASGSRRGKGEGSIELDVELLHQRAVFLVVPADQGVERIGFQDQRLKAAGDIQLFRKLGTTQGGVHGFADFADHRI